MKKITLVLATLVSISAFAGAEENMLDAKVKLINAINSSISFEITINNLTDENLYIATFSDRFHREIARKFGKDCIEKSFKSVTELSHFLTQDYLSVESLLNPIVENCYNL